MSDEVDVNKIVVEFVNQNLDRFYSTGKDLIKGTADKVRLYLLNTYKDYLYCIAARYSKAKTFLIRSEAISLYDFYVPTGVTCGRTKFKRPSFNEIAKHNQFAVVAGGGGSGKSMLMRHLFLSSLNPGGKVPIFLELRELNQAEHSLFDFIQETLHENHFKLDVEYIKKALENGHFVLFFDGFDELSRKLRKEYSKQIQRFAKLYDQNVVIVSSRPDDEFSGWPNFSIFNIDPLDLDQACLLIKKTPFEDSFKNKFIKDLRTHLFDSHHSFLSNPLLLSIMLLTYGESADIPNKLNIFYNQAYEALFQRHDVLKGAFQRDRVSKLNIQEFAAVFSAFSIQTYDKRLFQFTRSEALEYVEKAKSLTNLDFRAEDYLSDAVQATCLLVEEGLSLVFAHRSFQEYFAARFISDTSPDIQEKLIVKYSKLIEEDSVITLLHEIKPDVVETVLIIPAIESLERQIKVKGRVGPSHVLRFLKKNVESIQFIDGGAFFTPTDDSIFPIMGFAFEKCGYLVGWTGYSSGGSESPRNPNIEEGRDYEIGELSVRDEVFREIISDGVLSITTLQTLIRIKKALIAKHKAAQTSIHQLLIA